MKNEKYIVTLLFHVPMNLKYPYLASCWVIIFLGLVKLAFVPLQLFHIKMIE